MGTGQFALDEFAFEGLDLLAQPGGEGGRRGCRRRGSGHGRRRHGRQGRIGAVVQRQLQPQGETLGGVLQFAHVARPAVGDQGGALLGIGFAQRGAVALGGGQGEVAEQGQDVFAALAQGGDAQGGDIEPVVEVGAEAALVGGLAQVFLGGGDHPDIQGDLLVGAEALDLALLQQAQQLDLDIQAHALDLVEKEGAAAGVFEFADTALLGPGEGALFVAEEFALHHGFGEGAGVDGDEGAVAAIRQVVQGTGHHLLAGTGFAMDEHICLGRGEGADLVAQAGHAWGLADQPGLQLMALGQGQAQAAVFQHQVAGAQGAAHAVDQGVVGEGLFQEVIGAGAHGLDRQGHVAMTGDQHHRQFGVALVQLGEQLQAIDAGHADVAHHHAGPVAHGSHFQVAGIGQRRHLEAGQVQGLAQGQAQVGVIVDQQDLAGGVEGGQGAHGKEPKVRGSTVNRGLLPGVPTRPRVCRAADRGAPRRHRRDGWTGAGDRRGSATGYRRSPDPGRDPGRWPWW